MAGVNLSGFDKKMGLARGELQRVIPLFLRDAAQWMGSRLTDEVLNGQGGTGEAKTYPSGISQGAKGFVGIITSNLRNSIRAKRENLFLWQITQVLEAQAPYLEPVLAWSKEKYGKDFFEITVQLYGPKITKELSKLIVKYTKAVNQGRKLKYSNPFPA